MKPPPAIKEILREALEPASEMLEGKFLGVDVPLKDARFVVFPLPYERTTSYKKGTSNGPKKFLEGSLGVELWDEEVRCQTYKAGIHTLPPMTSKGKASVFFPKLEAEVLRIAAMKDKLLFCVGGEHSLSQATIPPFIKTYPGMSILHFDAHADLRPQYENSPHNHACALYPASRLCKTVQIGIRSVAEEEAHLVNSGNVTTFLMHENLDVDALIKRILAELTDTVYISIDYDGFDPSVIPGVGTPQPGGFSWHDGLKIFRSVIERKRVVGVDLMELCPLRDTVQSELAAAKLAYRLMGYLHRKPPSAIASGTVR